MHTTMVPAQWQRRKHNLRSVSHCCTGEHRHHRAHSRFHSPVPIMGEPREFRGCCSQSACASSARTHARTARSGHSRLPGPCVASWPHAPQAQRHARDTRTHMDGRVQATHACCALPGFGAALVGEWPGRSRTRNHAKHCLPRAARIAKRPHRMMQNDKMGLTTGVDLRPVHAVSGQAREHIR